MKNNKGISMITLIVTIIVMLILLALTYRIGNRYISRSKQDERKALISIMSSAVDRRQNDNNVDLMGISYYSGYHIPEEQFNQIAPLLKENVDYGHQLWYIVDSIEASKLGVSDAEQYLVNDLTKVNQEKGKYVAVVNYYTSEVYLIDVGDIHDGVIDGIIAQDVGDECTHRPTVATCTEGSYCSICHKKFSDALGHEWNFEKGPTCTEDQKCERCGYILKKATGHLYQTDWMSDDARGHYHVCGNIDPNTGIVCGAKSDFAEHVVTYTKHPVGEWKHTATCSVCEYSAEEECDKKVKIKYNADNSVHTTEHTVYCTVCGVEQGEVHTIRYRYIDKDTHMKYCSVCQAEWGEENHNDSKAPYGICDECGEPLNVDRKPVIVVATIQNTTPTDGAVYWAKLGDKIEVNITSDTVLGTKPKIKIQGMQISETQVTKADDVGMKWKATFLTSDYHFRDGVLYIEIYDVKSLWNVLGDKVTEPTDDQNVTYDATLPELIYLPE